MSEQTGGFHELPHTADWALEAWGTDQGELFRQAALGMYTLMHARLQFEPRETYHFEVTAPDIETRLVMFLSELLYFTQRDDIGFNVFDVSLEGERVIAVVEGAPVESIAKEIKAVTYHNLAVQETERGWEATIVFDV